MTLEQLEADNQEFYRLYAKYGPSGLAAKIFRLKSYKKYIQRYPFDGAEAALSLDFELPNNVGEPSDVAVVDTLPDDKPLLVEQAISSDFDSEFKLTLTKRQLRVLELLEQGYRPKDIYKRLGYKNTGGVRYIKWAIRQKYFKFKEQELYRD